MEKLTIKTVQSWFSKSSEIQTRKIKVNNCFVYVCYIDCLVDKLYISQHIIAPILNLNSASKTSIINSITAAEIEEIFNKEQIIDAILNGKTIIFAENKNFAVAANAIKFNMRSISEPPTSQVTKGPREGFVEDISTNLSMIRRKLKSPYFSQENITVGKQTKTKLSIVYLENIADTKMVSVIKNKLQNINIDGIIDSYYIETILEEGKLKFLRRIGNSEKPDVIAAKLLEGRIAILVDGSPIVLTLPFLLVEDLQSPEDYYTIPARTSFLRIIRLLGLIISVLLPGIYVSLQSYQYRVLPINFLITLLSSIEGISLPPLIEILFVLFLFDIINEASARMPKILGMALSIIGALVLGETSVQAGIISSPSIVVVAISSIMLFIVPDDVPQGSVLRILFTVIGGVAGFYGMLMSFIMVTTYLISADGYGTPLLYPYAPTNKNDKQDAIFKKNLLNLKHRPEIIAKKNLVRFKAGEKHD